MPQSWLGTSVSFCRALVPPPLAWPAWGCSIGSGKSVGLKTMPRSRPGTPPGGGLCQLAPPSPRPRRLRRSRRGWIPAPARHRAWCRAGRGHRLDRGLARRCRPPCPRACGRLQIAAWPPGGAARATDGASAETRLTAPPFGGGAPPKRAHVCPSLETHCRRTPRSTQPSTPCTQSPRTLINHGTGALPRPRMLLKLDR